jgi:hypothetical protein
LGRLGIQAIALISEGNTMHWVYDPGTPGILSVLGAAVVLYVLVSLRVLKRMSEALFFFSEDLRVHGGRD